MKLAHGQDLFVRTIIKVFVRTWMGPKFFDFCLVSLRLLTGALHNLQKVSKLGWGRSESTNHWDWKIGNGKGVSNHTLRPNIYCELYTSA